MASIPQAHIYTRGERVLHSHLGRYRSIGVFVEHVEGLLERLQLVLPQLLVDVERRCKGERRKKYGDEVAERIERKKAPLKWSFIPWGFAPSGRIFKRPFRGSFFSPPQAILPRLMRLPLRLLGWDALIRGCPEFSLKLMFACDLSGHSLGLA